VLLRAKSKGVHVDTLIGVAGVGLVGLDPREVGTFTLGEAVLAVELELGSDNGVLAPAMHVKGGLSENKCAGVGNRGSVKVVDVAGVLVHGRRLDRVGVVGVVGVGSIISRNLLAAKVGLVVGVGRSVPVSREARRNVGVKSAGVLEEAASVNEGIGVGSDLLRPTEGVDGIGKGINRISVVERLGTENLEKSGIACEGRAVIDVLIGLHNPDELLHGVVEVELDLVAGRTDRLITSELELRDQVLVRVLGHTTTLVSVKEHVVNVEGSGNDRLVVGDCGRNRASGSILVSHVDRRAGVARKCGNSPQALVNRANVKVDLDLVVLKGNQRKGKTGVCAKPELKGNVKGSLRKSVTGSANLARGKRVTRAINIGERGIGDEGELCGVSDHLEVAALLLRGHGELVPDVHPVTILAINALATNLDLNLSDKLLTGEIQPTSVNALALASDIGTDTHKLVDLGKCHL